MKFPAYILMKTNGKTFVGTGKSARLSVHDSTVFTHKFEEARIYTSLSELEEDCGWFTADKSHEIISVPITVNLSESEIFKAILKKD